MTEQLVQRSNTEVQVAHAQSTAASISASGELVPAESSIVGRPFPPGVSGNPGGRPKTRIISEAYRQILEEDGAEAYARVVARDALHSKKPTERLAAIQEITDRVEGKATQSLRVEATVHESTAQQILGLLETLTGSKSSE